MHQNYNHSMYILSPVYYMNMHTYVYSVYRALEISIGYVNHLFPTLGHH